MHVREARQVFPAVACVPIETSYGSKVSYASYFEQGDQVFRLLAHLGVVERSSIDEAFVDVTDAVAAAVRARHVNEMALDVAALPALKHIARIHLVQSLAGAPSKLTQRQLEQTIVDSTSLRYYCKRVGDHFYIAFLYIFLPTPDRTHLIDAAVLAEQIQSKIFAETLFTTSIGVAPNKQMAKMVSRSSLAFLSVWKFLTAVRSTVWCHVVSAASNFIVSGQVQIGRYSRI